MYLEGASWNRKLKSIVDQKAGEINFLMPIIYLQPTDCYLKKDDDYMY